MELVIEWANMNWKLFCFTSWCGTTQYIHSRFV